MCLTDYEFILNGFRVAPPKEWLDIGLIATFDEDGVQASITTTTFTFFNDEAQAIIAWRKQGALGSCGLYEGMPFEIRAFNDTQSQQAFLGYLDLSDDSYEEVSPVEVKVVLKKDTGILTLREKAETLTAGFLAEKGVLTNSDYVSIPFLTEAEKNLIDLLMIGLGLFVALKESAELIERLTTSVSKFISAVTPSPPSPVNLGGIVLAVLGLLIQIAYSAAILIYLINLGVQFTQFLISPVRFHKGIRVRKLMEKALNHLGYTFNTSIDPLKIGSPDGELTILPSKTSLDRNAVDQFLHLFKTNLGGVGHPSAGDFGYTLDEVIQLIHRLFGSKILIRPDRTVELHSLKSNFFESTATFVAPSCLNESKKFNGSEMKATRIYSFARDTNDFWTRDNYKGTVYEIHTEPITTKDDTRVTLKGIENDQFPYALGTRKNGLNATESTLLGMATIIDGLISAFGGSPTMASKITARIGMLKMETEYVFVPKLMRLNEQNHLPANYRDTWTAKYLWENFLCERSFVTGRINQWIKRSEPKMPMGLTGFIELIENAYFYSNDVVRQKATKIEWKMALDYANVLYRERDPEPNVNLKEIFFEQD